MQKQHSYTHNGVTFTDPHRLGNAMQKYKNWQATQPQQTLDAKTASQAVGHGQQNKQPKDMFSEALLK